MDMGTRRGRPGACQSGGRVGHGLFQPRASATTSASPIAKASAINPTTPRHNQ